MALSWGDAGPEYRALCQRLLHDGGVLGPEAASVEQGVEGVYLDAWSACKFTSPTTCTNW